MTKKKVNKRSLRPVLIASERTISDYSTFLERLLVGFADESVQSVLVCPGGCDVDSIVSGAVEVIRHPVLDLPFMEAFNTRMVLDRLAKFGPTVLHCLCESRAFLVRQWTRRLGLPYVLNISSLLTRRTRVSISPRRCAGISVPAETISASVAAVYPRFADRIRRLNVGTYVAESVCFNDPSRLPVMVVAHSLDNADDFENFFNAVRHLVLERYEFMVLVMGSGRQESQLRRLLAALDLLRVVTIVPRLRPWRSVLAVGDIFVEPQPSTAFSPLLLEAMSVGAAVATCRGGVDDLIVEDRTAVVFDPDDELSITTALQHLLDRREFARSIAAAAQENLRANYSVSNMVSTALRIYEDVEGWLSR